MKNASSYKPHKILFDKDLHGFALVWGFYPFGPCSPREIRAGDISPGESVESVVSDLFDNCRESSTNRPYFFQNKANFHGAENGRELLCTKRVMKIRVKIANFGTIARLR